MLNQWGFIKPTITLLLIFGITSCGEEDEENKTTSSSVNSNWSSSASMQTCTTEIAPSSPLRRLTRFEYENSVSDLLGINTSTAKGIPADSSDGFDNNAALQLAPELLVEKYVEVSEALAAEAVEDLSNLTDCNAKTTDEKDCAEQFAHEFGRRAFRRKMTSEDVAMFMDAYDAGSAGGTHAKGIEVMIRMALQSPHFLYRLESSTTKGSDLIPLGDFEIATRLSYFLWSTTPDDALLDAAEAGKLSTKEQVAAKSRQMLSSPKSRASVTNFLAQWSSISKLDHITKNSTLFPNYSPEVLKAMREELRYFVSHMFTTKDMTLENLFTSNTAFVSPALASIYDVDVGKGGGTNAPSQVNLPQEQGRSGLFTQAGFLAVQAHPDQTSPVLRGKFIRTNLLCDPPSPPPDNLDISLPDLSEGATARDRSAVHLSAGGSCSSCHTLMDPIGLAFENFDALGQFRLTESGTTIDASGEILFVDDPALEGEFVGVKPMAKKLADSKVVKNCVATHMFRYASGRFENAEDSCSVGSIQQSFIAADGDIVELMIAMTQTDAFLFRNQETR